MRSITFCAVILSLTIATAGTNSDSFWSRTCGQHHG